jgi:hypothetical protein
LRKGREPRGGKSHRMHSEAARQPTGGGADALQAKIRQLEMELAAEAEFDGADEDSSMRPGAVPYDDLSDSLASAPKPVRRG